MKDGKKRVVLIYWLVRFCCLSIFWTHFIENTSLSDSLLMWVPLRLFSFYFCSTNISWRLRFSLCAISLLLAQKFVFGGFQFNVLATTNNDRRKMKKLINEINRTYTIWMVMVHWASVMSVRVDIFCLNWARAFTQNEQTHTYTQVCISLRSYETSWARRLHYIGQPLSSVNTTHRRGESKKECSTMPQYIHAARMKIHKHKQYIDKVKKSQRQPKCVLCLLAFVAYTVWFICLSMYTDTTDTRTRVHISVRCTFVCACMLLDSNVCVLVNFQFVHSIAFCLFFFSALFIFSHYDFFLSFFDTIYCVHFWESIFFIFFFFAFNQRDSLL